MSLGILNLVATIFKRTWGIDHLSRLHSVFLWNLTNYTQLSLSFALDNNPNPSNNKSIRFISVSFGQKNVTIACCVVVHLLSEAIGYKIRSQGLMCGLYFNHKLNLVSTKLILF